ncbi:MAG TPA: lysylphosphatidylglycerol synthase transmembrane domain-containing protein [Chitinophagaceae bacterium]
MKAKFLTVLKYLFFIALGGFFVWLSVRHLTYEKWEQIKNAVASGRKWVILPVILFLMIAHYSRAIRWKLLMEPLGYKPSTFNVFAAVMIGYLVNSGAPRLGEVFKCTLLARYEKIRVDKLIGTILIERAVDLVCLIIVFISALIVEGDIFGEMMRSLAKEFFYDKTGHLSTKKLVIALGGFVLFFILFYIVLKRFGHIDIIARIKKSIKNIIHGLSSINNLEHKGWFIFHSILIWTMYWFASTAGLYALKETQYLGLPGGLATLVVGTVGIILTPGGIGAYPVLIAQLLGLYGLDPETTGIASGTLMWAAQTAIILLGGMICFGLISRYNKKKIILSNSQQELQTDILSKN